MVNPRCVLVLTVALLCFAWTGTEDAVAAESELPSVHIHPELGVQTFPPHTASRLQLTSRIRFHDHWFGDLVVMTGGVHQQFSSPSMQDHGYGAVALGPGLSSGETPDGWEFRASPRFTHVHHTTYENWRNNFWANMVADSDGDVRHRSGAELALGVTGPRFGELWDRQFVINTDAVVSWLPTSDIMTWGAGLMVGMTLR